MFPNHSPTRRRSGKILLGRPPGGKTYQRGGGAAMIEKQDEHIHGGKTYQRGGGAAMIEKQDEHILVKLQRDGRATNQQLAEEVGMSTSACWRRVRGLEQAGVIVGYSALVDREKDGFATSAILH